MPVFKRSKKDGHPYIIGGIPGLGLSTWQVSPSGVAILKRHHISDGDQLPVWLLRELLSLGAATTGHSGVGESVFEPAPTPRPEEELHLAFAESEGGWQTLVLFPELPSDLVQQILSNQDQSQIGRCGIRIDGTSTVMPATALWPGKGGKAWPVAPHEGRYTFELVGPWPVEWNPAVLKRGLSGLSPSGVLFESNAGSGQRVAANTPILPGQSYVFVFPSARNVTAAIPRSIARVFLGLRSNWQAWRLNLPSFVDETTRDWLIGLGFGVELPLWRLAIASPAPKRMQVNNIGIYTSRDELLIAALPDSSGLLNDDIEIQAYRNEIHQFSLTLSPPPKLRSQRRSLGREHDDARYFALQVQRLGTYEIRARRGRVRPLVFLVEPVGSEIDLSELGKSPEPLRLSIAGADVRAFTAVKSPSTTFDEIAKHPEPRIECMGAVSLAWSFKAERESRTLQPAEASIVLADVLRRAALSGSQLNIGVDGGNFGEIELVVEAAPTPRDVRIIPADILRVANWLAAWLVSLRWRQVDRVPIGDQVRSCFRTLRDYGSCASLANANAVPRPMVAHISALAQRLREATDRGGNCSGNEGSYCK